MVFVVFGVKIDPRSFMLGMAFIWLCLAAVRAHAAWKYRRMMRAVDRMLASRPVLSPEEFEKIEDESATHRAQADLAAHGPERARLLLRKYSDALEFWADKPLPPVLFGPSVLDCRHLPPAPPAPPAPPRGGE